MIKGLLIICLAVVLLTPLTLTGKEVQWMWE